MDFLIQNFDFLFKVLLTAAAGFSLYFGIKSQITSIRTDIDHIKDNQKDLAESFKQLGSILTKVAVQDTRLNMIDKKLDELCHYQGFVGVRP